MANKVKVRPTLSQIKKNFIIPSGPKHGWGGTPKEAGALDSFMFEWAPDSILDFGCGKGAFGKNVLRRL